jgi:hypothetical protein
MEGDRPRPSSSRGEEWRTPEPTDLIFPKWQSELFKTINEEENLRLDRHGWPRTAYSVQHTYISMRLMEGVNIYQMTKNCRTSVGMIEIYYGVHVKNSLDAAAINVVPSGKDVMEEEEWALARLPYSPNQKETSPNRFRTLPHKTSLHGEPLTERVSSIGLI